MSTKELKSWPGSSFLLRSRGRAGEVVLMDDERKPQDELFLIYAELIHLELTANHRRGAVETNHP